MFVIFYNIEKYKNVFFLYNLGLIIYIYLCLVFGSVLILVVFLRLFGGVVAVVFTNNNINIIHIIHNESNNY